MKNRMNSITVAAPFPVIFFDGYIEVDNGNIVLHTSLGFQKFKDLISQKLGIPPPRQFLSYLVRHNNDRSSLEFHHKLLIDESFDFNAITKETDCFILAILKQFRRTRLGCCGERSAFIVAMEEKSTVPKKAIFKSFLSNALNVDLPIAVGKRHWNFMLRQSEEDLMLTEKAYTTLAKVTSMMTDKEMEKATSSEMVNKATKSMICQDCVDVEEKGQSVDFKYCSHNEVAYTKFSEMPNLPPSANFLGLNVAPSCLLASPILYKEKKINGDGSDAIQRDFTYDIWGNHFFERIFCRPKEKTMLSDASECDSHSFFAREPPLSPQ